MSDNKENTFELEFEDSDLDAEISNENIHAMQSPEAAVVAAQEIAGTTGSEQQLQLSDADAFLTEEPVPRKSEDAFDHSREEMAAAAAEEMSANEDESDPLSQIAWQAENLDFIETDRVASIIESILFSSDRPVSIATIKQVFKGSQVRTKDIVAAIENLASEYAATNRGVTIEEINGGYQIRTKVDNSEYLKRLMKTRPFKLSGPALEVLAIVAYRQPIIKAEVDQIRGVESGHLMRALMERGLISFAGKSEKLGRAMQYQTTRKFLEIFGLRNLKELPTLSEIDQLLPDGIGDEEAADKPKLADITGALSKEITGKYSEGEEELVGITQELQEINTSTEFFEQEKIRQRETRDKERAQDIRDAVAVGETVDEKELKWLARYEQRLQAALDAPAGAAAAADDNDLGVEAASTSVDSVDGVDGVAAMADAKASAEGSHEGEEASLEEELLQAEDLEGHIDWDDEIESGSSH